MGLAASQTRFLTLTARKSNIEYQGQQINQQRTVLANQSADLYNRMLNLSVPTPPSMTSGEYYNVTQEFYNQNTGLNTQLIGSPSLAYSSADGIAFKFKTGYTENGIEKTGNMSTIYTTIANINTQLGTLGLSTVTVGNQTQFDNLTDEQKVDIQQALIALNVMNVDDETGTLISALKLDIDGDKTLDANESLDSDDFAFGTHFDDIGYDEAMNSYDHEKFVYEKAMADINAETESIYQKDKTLELKLKQLDSEHSAVQTEVEAVKKVIDKNVESTFKTFGT